MTKSQKTIDYCIGRFALFHLAQWFTQESSLQHLLQNVTWSIILISKSQLYQKSTVELISVEEGYLPSLVIIWIMAETVQKLYICVN